MILFTHHVELQHVPVLAVFVVVGIWLGWQVMSLLCKRREETEDVSGSPPA
jgi:hypothetical protein